MAAPNSRWYLVTSFVTRAVFVALLAYLYSSNRSSLNHAVSNKFTAIHDSRYYDSGNITTDQINRAQKLAGAIRYRTISDSAYSARPYLEQILKLHAYLRQQFPLVHSLLKWETVNQHSLLYTWECNPKGDGIRTETKTSIMLCAHMDVVPDTPPNSDGTSDDDEDSGQFKGEIKDGYIWGRGSLDFKNGVISILSAVEELLDAGYEIPCGHKVLLAFGHDEEVGGNQGARWIGQLLAERGISKLDLILDEGTPIVTGGLVPAVDPSLNVAMLGVAEKGIYSVNITVVGGPAGGKKQEAGHSSMPPVEGTVITKLAKILSLLEYQQINEPLSQSPASEMFQWLAPYFPSALKRMALLGVMRYADYVIPSKWIRPIVSKVPKMNSFFTTVQSVNIISGGNRANVIPSSAAATLNYRLLPGTSSNRIRKHIEQTLEENGFLADNDVSLADGLSFDPPPVTSTQSSGFQYLAAITEGWWQAGENSTIMGGDHNLKKRRQIAVVPSLMVAGTDTKHYAHLSDTIIRFSPIVYKQGDLERLHGLNERISLDAFSKSIEYFKQVIVNLDHV